MVLMPGGVLLFQEAQRSERAVLTGDRVVRLQVGRRGPPSPFLPDRPPPRGLCLTDGWLALCGGGQDMLHAHHGSRFETLDVQKAQVRQAGRQAAQPDASVTGST